MNTKKLLALLTAAVMVLGVFPAMTFAAEKELTCTDSYVSSTAETGIYTQDGFTTRPYTLSWKGGAGNGYRMGVVAFDVSSVDKTETIQAAKLEMTVYKTQNINQIEASSVTVYSFDPSLADNTNSVKPANGKKVGVIALTDAPTQATNVNITYTAELDLSQYFADYPAAEKIALYITNREDIAECSSFGLVGFYGKDDGAYAPKLSITYGKDANVNLTLKSDDGAVDESIAVSGVAEGDSYVPSENDAPLVITKYGKIYVRDNLEPVILTAGANEYTATYTKREIQSVASPAGEFSVIAGDEPILPKTLTATLDDGTTTVPVSAVWSVEGDPNQAGTVSCVAAVDGYEGDPITCQIEVLPCDNSVETFYSAGGSNGAQFVWNNKLGYSYGGGSAIFDTTFVIDEGGNKLISYCDADTSSFDGAAALLRYMNADVFEYHDGGWKNSTVKCETGKTYRLRTVIDFSSRKYQMYITDEDGVTAQVTNGPAAFRSSTITSVDRMCFHGSGEAGPSEGVVLSHRSYWESGYTELTVKEACGDITFSESSTKWITGTKYVQNNPVKVRIADGKFYALSDVNSLPTSDYAIDEEHNSFTIEYNEVTAEVSEMADVTVVQGDVPAMPAQVSIALSDGQSVNYGVNWDLSAVDTGRAGTYTAEGTTEIGLDVSCNVVVKAVESLPFEEGKTTVATNNGGWNWYVEPSGTHIQPGDALATRYESGQYSSNNGYKFQHDRTYMGWVEDGGDIVIAQLDHDTGEYKRVVIHEKLESDDHNNPAVVILPDGRILAVYSMHTNEPYMYFRISKYPEDISEWNKEQFYYCVTATDSDGASNATYNATYPTVFMVHDDEGIEGNDVIYIGWRGVHWKPTLAKFNMPAADGVFETDSTGSIVPAMGQTQFANTSYWSKDDGGRSDSGRRPYTKYDYDFDRNKIYITFTANHPDNDVRNNIYYLELNIADQMLYTAKGAALQPLPEENRAEYKSRGANGTNGQWGVVTDSLVGAYPELYIFNASEQISGDAERRGWTWDIAHNEKGEPCVVYVDVTATPPGENGALPSLYYPSNGDEGASRSHHYYWYARWDSESGQWIKTFLTYGGKWFHQNVGQERCYSGGLTFDHNYPGNALFLSIPTYGKYGNMFEIYRWESDDDGATWTKRQPITQDSKIGNARPNAIYNYKMNEDGTNAGPRLLWISGEYRYWMNYEYKTGVMTDYAADGFITQDDPEMFADAALYSDGQEVDTLPVGENVNLTAKFTVSNISIGDGKAKLALAHYSADGELKGVRTVDEVIPARSVPQIGMIGAAKLIDDGSPSPWAAEENRAPSGDPEIVVDIDYAADIAEGDRVALFAWDMGIEQPLSSIISIPYETATNGNRYLFSDAFTYDGTKKLVLDQDESTFNGWVAKGYNVSGAVDFNDNNYVAVTKAPFGNTGLHLYRSGDSGIMVSHALPDTDGRDYTIEITMRAIDEISWNNTDNQGFTLSHGIPTQKGDMTNSSSAFQFRHKSAWRDENGRGTSGNVRNTRAFDDGSETEIFHDVSSTIDVSGMEYYPFDKYTNNTQAGYYDPESQTYLHNYYDSLYTGSLYRVKLVVHPAFKQIEMSINDGYKTARHTAVYNDASSYDWDANPIDTITFSIGTDKWGELYIDNFRMYLSSDSGEIIRAVSVKTPEGADLLGESEWRMVPNNGAYAFITSTGNSIDVNSQKTAVGSAVGTWTYNGGDNQIFYLEETEGGYLIKGKQSGLYLAVAESGGVTLQAAENATVFTIDDIDEAMSADVQAFLEELMNN